MGLVKTVKFEDPKYVGDPINAIKIFNEKEIDELVFLDITATRENRAPNFELISKIAGECFMPFAYGGGIRNIEDIKKLFSIGVEKAVINTYGFLNPEFIRQAAKKFGSQSIVVSIDVKRNENRREVMINNGKKGTGISPQDAARKMEEMGAGEILLNSVDNDGAMSGYDLELIKEVSESVNIPVIACGGAGKIADFKSAIDAGASAVAAGSMFVFVGSYKAVLINYPSPAELKEISS